MTPYSTPITTIRFRFWPGMVGAAFALLLVLLYTRVAYAQDADGAQAPQLSPAALHPLSTTLPFSPTFATYLPVALGRDGPSRPVPADLTMFVSLNTNLTWSDTSPDAGATWYTLYFKDAWPLDTVMADGLPVPGFDPPELKVDTRYWWRVVAHRPNGELVAGPVWTFKTEWPVQSPDLESMVEVPDGPFTMGCEQGRSGAQPCSYDIFHSEEPLRRVWLSSFWIDRYEVTNQEYARCVVAGACKRPVNRKQYDDPAYALAPVVYVSWWNAQDYCAWEGKRLPTEAEWEKAARGSLDTRIYPWGDSVPTCDRVNNKVYQRPCGTSAEGVMEVGHFPRGASPYGAHDMAGNAVEWVNDKYDVWYYRYAPNVDPQGPEFSRVTKDKGNPDEPYWENQNGFPVFSIRGGSWDYNDWYMRVFHRHWGHHGPGSSTDAPYFRNPRTGFRCAVTR